MTNLTESEINQFESNGFLVIENFISHETCDKLKHCISQLVESHDFTNFNHIFATNGQGVVDKRFHDKYFFESWNKIHFFLEKDQTKQLGHGDRPFINKIGHNLHNELPPFNQVSFDQRVKSICQDLGFSKPAICQSMYIFKAANGGSLVPPHQDASFLWTEPECRILGFWIPLEDVTLENGCLWAVPGSHKDGLLNNVRYIHDPSINEYATRLTADYPHVEHEKYQPILMKRGELLLIHGYVLHKSNANLSDNPRDVYTWHIVDTHNTTWHKDNWIRPTAGVDEFTKL